MSLATPDCEGQVAQQPGWPVRVLAVLAARLKPGAGGTCSPRETTIGGTMRRKETKKPVRTLYRMGSARPYEESNHERAQNFKSVASLGHTEASIEDALNEVFTPEYGGSE